MNTLHRNLDFQLGLLHFAHLLVTIDGFIDEREKEAIVGIKESECISDKVFQFFVNSISGKTERDIYLEGIDRLNRCSEEEKLCAFVYLYRLAQTNLLEVKEVRLLLYSLKKVNIEFNDVVLSARLAHATDKVIQLYSQKRSA